MVTNPMGEKSAKKSQTKTNPGQGVHQNEKTDPQNAHGLCGPDTKISLKMPPKEQLISQMENPFNIEGTSSSSSFKPFSPITHLASGP